MLTGKTEHMTVAQFDSAYQQAAPGESWIYATGSLAYDRDKLVNKNKVEIDAVANFAMQLQISKRIELTQKRYEHHWQYISTKRKVTRS